MNKKSPWLLISLSLIAVASIYYVYIRIAGIDLLGLVEKNFKNVLLASTFIFIGEIVKALRSEYVLNKLGYRVKLKNVVIARFTGNFLGIVTPASFASEPGRVMSLAMLEAVSVQAVMAVGVLETFYDSVILAVVAFFFSLLKLPSSILIFLSSLFILGLWLFIFGSFIFTDSLFKKIIARLERRLGKRIKDFSNRVFSRYAEFVEFTKTGLSFNLSLVSVLLTILSIAIYSLSFLFIDPASGIGLLELLTGLVAYASSYTMQVFPTPGGSGFFEYALTITLNSRASALWRISFLLMNIIPALVILAFFVKIRHVVVENFKKSIAE